MTPNSPIEEQWTVIMSQSEATPTAAPLPIVAASEPKIELTINTKPTPAKTEASPVEKKDCTCKAKDKDSSSSSDEDEEPIAPRNTRGRRRRHRDGPPPPPPPRCYIERTPSPIRGRGGLLPYTPATTPINSSSDLLAVCNDFDGIMELPFPARSSAYMVTFPFTNTDVKKWTWLFRREVFDTWMPIKKSAGDRYAGDDEDEHDIYDEWGTPIVTNRHRRSRSRMLYPEEDMPKVFLSRALDTQVIPEEKKDVRFWIVVENSRGKTVKLMRAESRRAAGIMVYYEALSGNSISFVGAVAKGAKNRKLKGKKFVKMENLEEVAKMEEAGDELGIVC